MTQKELDKTIRLHQKWLNNDPEGVRADMSGANMRDADMRWADMSSANMSGANMRDADMSEANMSRADARDADISGADIDYVTITLWCGTLRIRIDNRITSQLLYHVLSCVEVSPDVSDDVKKVLLSPEVVAIANQFHRCKSGEVPKIGDYRNDAL